MSTASGEADWFDEALRALTETQRFVPAFECARARGLSSLRSDELRPLLSGLRRQGFLERAEAVAHELAGRRGDAPGSSEQLLLSEVATLRGERDPVVPSPGDAFAPRPQQLLLLATTSIDDADTNYTRRSHAFATTAKQLGVSVSVVTPMGVGGADAYVSQLHDGIEYLRIPGPARGSRPFDDWLQLQATRLASVVRKARPSALLAASDFVNGLAAASVARAYGIPLIYDARGMHHDAWLERSRAEFGWSEAQVPGRWGMPEAWSLRNERELSVCSAADLVIAASSRMSAVARDSGIPEDRVVELVDASDASGVLEALERARVVSGASAALVRAGLQFEAIDEITALIATADRSPLDRVAVFGGVGTVRSIRTEGWRHSSLEPLPITLPMDWHRACADNRSQAFHLHAWDFMVPFLKAWSRDRDRSSLDWCLERAADWCSAFEGPDDFGTMAWYDMAIGLRAPRLAYLLQEAIHEDVAEHIIAALASGVARHQKELFADRAFNPRTNHGFYTAVGQLSFARTLSTLPGMELVAQQGEERLAIVVATQFGKDGGHLEHSPDYHRMLLASFQDAVADGLMSDPEVSDRIARAAAVMGWFIQPDRRIVQIGDSPARLVSDRDRAMQHPGTLFLASGGKKGNPTAEELLLLRDSGYGIVRSPQPRSESDHRTSSYLTFMAGFHSRAHKHCDDLAVTWFDRQQEILIDAGRFGYLDALPADDPARKLGFFYGRPERQFVEGVRAHNTVQMDDRDHERRERAPYGSALVDGKQASGQFSLEGFVDHGQWQHRRNITFLPGSWLLVEDDIETTEPHDFTVWWNFARSLGEPVLDDACASFELNDDRGTLHVRSLSRHELVPPVAGQAEPLRGWRSRSDYEFTESWSLGFRASGPGQHRFRTLMTFEPTQVDVVTAGADPTPLR